MGQITEIYGESSVGKTQICLQLALNAQLAESQGGLNKKVVYLQTECVFPSSRLNQMMEGITSKHPQNSEAINFLDNIFIQHVLSADNLIDVVCKQLPILFKQKADIGLVIIDSIAAVFRTETFDYSLRAQNFRKIIESLMQLGVEYGCCIVIVNQAASFESKNGISVTVPSLGIAWSSLVNTRLEITKKRHKSQTIRQMEVKFSPRLPTARATFNITQIGLTD